MEKLTQLISTFSASEVKTIKKFYSLKSSSQSSMRFKLFLLILDKPGISDHEAGLFFNKKPSDTSFSMLKKRLRDDLVRLVVWEHRRTKFKTPVFKARFECRLLIAESEILIARGATEMAIDCLQKAKKLAESYELTNELIIVNEQLIQKVAIREGFKTYARLAAESMEQFDTIKFKFKAQDYLRQLTIPNLFQSNKENVYLKKAAAANRQLRKLSETSKSIEIRFWYLRSEIYYNHLRKNYEEAYRHGLSFVQLIEESPVVYSLDNMGGANMQLAMVSLYLNRLEDAATFATQSASYFKLGSPNYANAKDIFFLAQYYQGHLDTANQILKELLQIKSMRNNKFMQSKWGFFQANLCFSEGKYDEALALLQQQTELFSDKSGWRLGIKILEMMCIVEMNHDDWLDYRIETFRKLLSDLRTENIARAKLIHQIFKTYIKTGYSWRKTVEMLPEHVMHLRSGAGDYFWDPAGHELQRFDNWLDTKLSALRAVG
jgi:tetratricopeptide (TPR) repeat protein